MASSGRKRFRWVLLACLAALGVAYLALLPRLRQMSAETERLRQQSTAQEVEATRLGGLRRALDEARANAARSPRDAAAQIDLANRAAEAGQPDEARRAARLAAGLLPHDPTLWLLLAEIERTARDYNAAIDAYKAALALDPKNERALTGLGFLYISFGWPLEAEAALEPAVRAAPENPYLKVALAAAYTQHQEWGAAEKLLLEARQLAPEEATLWSPLVHLYNQTHREREAVTVAREALARLPGNLGLLNEMAQAFYELRDLPNAVATLRQVIALDPENVPAHYYLALCHQRSGQAQEATRELEQVQRLDPEYAQTRLLLGRIYLQSGRAAEGRRLLEESRRARARQEKRARAGLVVASKPRSAEAHWQMARVYEEEGDLPHMRVELRKTLELDAGHAGALGMTR